MVSSHGPQCKQVETMKAFIYGSGRVTWWLIKMVYAALLLMTAVIMWIFCTILTLFLAV
jgi:hypothetical protein